MILSASQKHMQVASRVSHSTSKFLSKTPPPFVPKCETDTGEPILLFSDPSASAVCTLSLRQGVDTRFHRYFPWCVPHIGGRLQSWTIRESLQWSLPFSCPIPLFWSNFTRADSLQTWRLSLGRFCSGTDSPESHLPSPGSLDFDDVINFLP